MARNFSWSNFSLQFLKAVVYGSKTPKRLQPSIDFKEVDYLIPYMDDICIYPNDTFVRKYRREIEDYFLAESNHLVQVCKKLEKLNYGGIRVGDNEEMLMKLRQKRFTSTLCACYLAELRLQGKNLIEQEDSIFSIPKRLDLLAAQEADIRLFPYQQRAVEALEDFFIKKDSQAGMLVMPTGSGKTRTSVYYLLKEMISQGYQVIWLAHRSMLIEQAADTFYTFAPIIKEKNPLMEEFKMVCVSGKHATVKALEKDDNLIISSVQSLCNNTVYLPNILAEKVIIVVDEAHHTLAPSYRRIIRDIRQKRPSAKLLGLTATPVRLTDAATAALMKIFDRNIIYSVTMSELIANGTLSTPSYLPKETNVDIEAIINIDEERYIKKWGEMPESLMEKVAKTNERNELIVNEYIANKDTYGKTIVFALNAIHCLALDDEFKRRGIRSGYVYNLNKDNASVIDRFRHNQREDGIDVLININILTEGSDIPDIQTVFLTRPTSSDTLLMQMVGRGMRGVSCGGTETVNIVDFCDKWSSITRWMNPRFLFEEEEGNLIETARGKSLVSLIPIDMIRDMIRGITYKGAYVKHKNSTLPIGWYDVINEVGNDAKILVFQNQIKGYETFKANFQKYIDDEELDGQAAMREFFRGFGPVPFGYELEDMISFIRHEKEFPEFHKFEEREVIEPYKIAMEIKEHDLSYSEIIKKISDICNHNKQLIESLYGSEDHYRERITDCMLYPHGIVPIGTIIEEVEKAEYKFSEEPLEETIDELLDEVIKEQSHLLPNDFVRPDIYWTDVPKASYFGVFYHDYNVININSLLNSKSIPREVVKYIIYHECLHQGISGHPAEFRELEHQYPNFQEYEHFLDYTLADFNLEYAM